MLAFGDMISSWTPSVDTFSSQLGSTLLGGRFLATPTIMSTGRRVYLMPHKPRATSEPMYFTCRKKKVYDILKKKIADSTLHLVKKKKKIPMSI